MCVREQEQKKNEREREKERKREREKERKREREKERKREREKERKRDRETEMQTSESCCKSLCNKSSRPGVFSFLPKNVGFSKVCAEKNHN